MLGTSQEFCMNGSVGRFDPEAFATTIGYPLDIIEYNLSYLWKNLFGVGNYHVLIFYGIVHSLLI